MTQWNPTQYLKFGAERLRPALDLLNQIPLENPKTVVDLGCGPGNVTALLKKRWQDADVIGMDNSEDMLEKAAASYPYIVWQQTDLNQWAAKEPFDLIYSNACLHWLPHHNDLFSRLMNSVNTGGVFAVQMPQNFAAASHQSIRDVLGADHPLSPGFPVHEVADYYEWLAPLSPNLNIWETTYVHELEGENPVSDWMKGAALRPILAGLTSDQEKADFEQAYRTLIKERYPASSNGKTLLPFKRLFIVAVKA